VKGKVFQNASLHNNQFHLFSRESPELFDCLHYHSEDKLVVVKHVDMFS